MEMRPEPIETCSNQLIIQRSTISLVCMRRLCSVRLTNFYWIFIGRKLSELDIFHARIMHHVYTYAYRSIFCVLFFFHLCRHLTTFILCISPETIFNDRPSTTETTTTTHELRQTDKRQFISIYIFITHRHRLTSCRLLSYSYIINTTNQTFKMHFIDFDSILMGSDFKREIFGFHLLHKHTNTHTRRYIYISPSYHI